MTYNLIRFKGVPLTLEGQFTWRAGFEPSSNSFTCTPAGYATLAADLRRAGDLRFYSSNDTTPDLTIQDLRIADFQAAEIARDINPPHAPIIQKYRVVLTDARETYKAPRGGRANLPAKRAATAADQDEERPEDLIKTNKDLIEYLIGQMGLPDVAGVHEGVNQFPFLLTTAGLEQHAATALADILDAFGMVLCPQMVGGTKVYFFGEGPALDLPAADKLPEIPLPGVDRRGSTVIVTSRPTPAIETKTVTGPSDRTWTFVMKDPLRADGVYRNLKSIDDLGGDPIATLRRKLSNVARERQQLYLDQLYRSIRLSRADFGEAPITRVVKRLKNESNPEGGETVTIQDAGLIVEAKIAVKDPITGRWRRSSSFVRCTPVGLEFSVLTVKEPLITLDVDDTDDPFAHAKELADGDLRVTFSREIRDDQKRPVYFDFGLRQDTGGLTVLGDAEIQNALSDGKSVVLQRPEMQLVQEQGKPDNKDRLTAQARKLAERFVITSGREPLLAAAAGFHRVELSGRVSEVRISQDPPRTDAYLNTYWMPSEYYLAQVRKRTGNGSGAGTSIVRPETKRLFDGTGGGVQPAVPLGFASNSIEVPPGTFPCLASVDGGKAGSPTETCTLTYKLFDQTGQPLKFASGDLVKEQIPAVSRFATCEYVSPPDLSPALAYRDVEGTIKLWAVGKEIPKTDWVTALVEWTVDGDNDKIQGRYREFLVLEAKDAGELVDLHTGEDC
ncbi:hypothetical protein [Humisphaera borealis]|uniref:Uncharacterized protein n=1 Tax=Humisphaera borealis TaxID=2807512 RepID=A0A7M2X188_9BACT|nr:hypothetical protein [Humisphaera borealis]QOV90881.1 hypothetical protein IPV69_05845 [Humisphaera borealis]